MFVRPEKHIYLMGNGGREEKKQYKKGVCSFCGVLQYYKLLITCINRASHVNWQQKSNHMGILVV